MPCYLFTYHGYGTWMPDHPRGYVRRKEGVFAADLNMATYYRRNLHEDVVTFSADIQNQIITTALEAFRFQNLRGHAIATELTHIHVLVSWNSNRTWQIVRRQLRSSLTRSLNREIELRSWFSKQPSRKRICTQQHFDYLKKVYLPKHSGLKWCEDLGDR